ncbi:hypothetical protein NEISICOT_03388 [Neisseria sicca ATCC 29256]|uniref:Uncharacterized protein n=1 Tax=Neisseria sicca ATCC 29256 TaxID=547045 RepID=C6MA07_NEISI|nr:hypothetical protein NEISICOT_03388 [Neisseria sicca ATCC 29256]
MIETQRSSENLKSRFSDDLFICKDNSPHHPQYPSGYCPSVIVD